MKTYTPEQIQSVFENTTTLYRTIKAVDGEGFLYIAELDGGNYAISRDEYMQHVK